MNPFYLILTPGQSNQSLRCGISWYEKSIYYYLSLAPMSRECVRICGGEVWIAAMPMSLEDNPGHRCSKTKGTEMICSLLTTNKKDKIWSSSFICSQREHACFSCIAVWKDYRYDQIYHSYISRTFFLVLKCLK